MFSQRQSLFVIALCLAICLSPAAYALDGDFNGDGFWDCDDLNALSQAIVSGSTDQLFDMDGDGSLTIADLDAAGTGWLAVGGANNPALTGGHAFVPGDANLDGLVDGSDFGLWNASKFTGIGLYCSGDFNVDGTIDENDFNLWNENRFRASASLSELATTSVVPEPAISGGILWWLSVGALRFLRGRRG